MATLRAAYVVTASVACVMLVVFFSRMQTIFDTPQMPNDARDEMLRQSHACLGAFFVFAVISNVIWMIWIYGSWKSLHAAVKLDDNAPSPVRAVLFLLVPIVNFFWAFIAVGSLCTRMNAELARLGNKRRAPTALGVVACLCGTWSWAFLPKPFAYLVVLVPLMWFFVMRGVDLGRVVILSNATSSAQPQMPS